MLNASGVTVVEVVRGFIEKSTYGVEIGNEVDEGDEVDKTDELEEREIDSGKGTSDFVISAG